MRLVNKLWDYLGGASRDNAQKIDPSRREIISIDDDPFLKNISSTRDDAMCRTVYHLSYDDGWIKTHVDFEISDGDMNAAPHAGAFFAERRGEAREKLKNAVICLARLLPPRKLEEPVIMTCVSSTSYRSFSPLQKSDTPPS